MTEGLEHNNGRQGTSEARLRLASSILTASGRTIGPSILT